jgi:hypothetical protein
MVVGQLKLAQAWVHGRKYGYIRGCAHIAVRVLRSIKADRVVEHVAGLKHRVIGQLPLDCEVAADGVTVVVVIRR